MNEFVYLEGLIAQELGISTATLRKGRKLLVEGEHWGRIRHGKKERVAYSMDGVSALLGKKEAKAVLGTKAIAALEQSEIGLILHAADIGACAGAGGGASTQGEGGVEPVDPSRLLAAPWTCPAAVLVVNRLTKNRRILLAVLEESWVSEHGFEFFHKMGLDPRGRMRVRVKNTGKFIKGMAVECRHVEQDLWECTQRMPRWKGRY